MPLKVIVGVRIVNDSVRAWEVVVVHIARDVVVARACRVCSVVLGSWEDCVGCLMLTGHHRTSVPGARAPTGHHLSPCA